ncbi:MAG: hypothetical protein WA101_00165 [Minisyncoccia bacterium]
MKNLNKKSGISILGALLLGVILIIVLSYFNVNLKAVVESPSTQSNLNYVGSSSRSLWNDYLKQPIANVFNSKPVQYFWNSFLRNMQNIHDGKGNDFERTAPTININ